MKQIIAIVRPFLAEKVLAALEGQPLEALAVREVKGFGRQKSYLDEYRGSEYSLAYLPKVQLTLWVDDAHAAEVIRAIVTAARTGRMGDGKIFVVPVDTGSLAPIAAQQPGPSTDQVNNNRVDRLENNRGTSGPRWPDGL